eukprot:INCI1488.2.p1 GENE.INCI1488.2~~INCI1488.2.p1  ORF type:complete len:255 (+),score=37.50 INCI1488.2:267-1031(+)
MASLSEQVPLYKRLLLSATAGCVASTICHPLDVVRVQLQTDAGGYSGPLDAGIQIVRRGGLLSLWDGLSAAYMRQFSYSMIRIGLFSYLLDGAERRQIADEETCDDVSFGTKLLLGSVSGSVGSVIGNPAEVAIVRMCNDSKLPPEQRRNYRSSVHAVFRIAREEGLAGLSRGVVNSTARAAVLNSVLLATYSQAKEQLVEWQPSIFTSTTSIPTLFFGSLFSAFFGVGAAMPLDVVKSRFVGLVPVAVDHGLW